MKEVIRSWKRWMSRLAGGLVVASLAASMASASPRRDSPRTMDPRVVRSGLHAAENRVRTLLAAGDFERARFAVGKALASCRQEGPRGRLRWLAAEAELRAQRPQQALAYLRTLLRSDHPLAPWAKLRAVRLVLTAQPAEALAWSASLASGWAGAGEARGLEALAAAKAGRDRLARSKLESLLGDGVPRDERQGELALALAEVLLRSDAAADRQQALLWCLRIEASLPRSSQARAALALRSQHCPGEGCGAAQLVQATAALDEVRAAASLRLGDASAAQQSYRLLVARAVAGSAAHGRASLGEARSALRLGQTAEAQKQLQAVAASCGDAAMRAEAWYLLGESYKSARQSMQAIEAYDAVVAADAGNSLSDDALTIAAALSLDQGDRLGAMQRLRTVVDAQKAGDMREEARFRLSMLLRADGKRSEALGELTALQAMPGIETAEGERGRAAYWQARLKQELGDAAAAAADFERLATTMPPCFYAQRALDRLAALDGERAAAHVRNLQRLAKPAREPRFLWHQAFETTAWRRAVELLRVDEVGRARRELEAWRQSAELPNHEALWASAALFEAAGAAEQAVRLLRTPVMHLQQEPFASENVARLRLAYPQPYAALFSRAAKRAEVPLAMLYAIGREESSFAADAVSPKKAYGLLQILVPTARSYDVQRRRQVTAEQLRQPAINIPIGANFLAFLQQRYAHDAGAIVAAYNAGPQAVDRWRSGSAPAELDEWIESIPYKETRRYTRRVLQSYGIYTWLAEGKLPR